MESFLKKYSHFRQNTYKSIGSFGNFNFCWTNKGWLNLWDDELKSLTHIEAEIIQTRIQGIAYA